MFGSIPRRWCAALLTVLVVGLVGLVGAPPAMAEPAVNGLGEAILYFTASDGLTRVGPYGSNPKTFPVADPAGVALDVDGAVYVAGGSGAGPLVREFKPDATWGESLFPDLSSASDVAVRDGRVVVADSDSLQVKDPDDVAAIFAPGVHPTKVVSTAAAVYFIDGDDGGVYRYRSGDGVQVVVPSESTSGLAADAAGNLYLGQPTRIVKYDPVQESETVLVGNLDDAPVDLAVSESGDLYYASSDGKILCRPAAEFSSTTVATGIEGLTSIAVRTAPTMPGAVSAEGEDGQVRVFWSPSGTNGGGSDIRYEVATFVGDEIGEPVPAPDVPVCATRETTCTIENLENGKTYMFGVAAFNTADGNDTGGSLPNQSNSVSPHIGPDKPVFGTPVPGNAAATVTFTPGADNGVPTRGWMISVDRVEWRGVNVVPTAENEFEVVFDRLVNDETNTLYLRAYDPATDMTGAVASTTVTPDSDLPAVPWFSEVRAGERSATLFFPPIDPGISEITGYEASVNGAVWTPVAATDGLPSDDESSPTETPSTPSEDVSPPADEPTTPSDDESPPADGDDQSAQSEGTDDGSDTLSVVIENLTQPANLIRLRAKNAEGAGVYASTMVFPTQVVAPGAPADVALESGDERLTVVFMPSRYPADRFEVKVGDGEWTPLTLDDIDRGGRQGGVVTGLQNGTTYEVRVRGVNQVDDGEESEPASGTPAARPSAPRELQATPADASARLSFLPPADDGGDPSHLTYQVLLENSEDWEPLTTEPGTDGALIATVSDLSNDETWNIRLRAHNSSGGSEEATVAVTPSTLPPTTPPTSEPTTTPTTPQTSAPTTTAPASSAPATTAPAATPTTTAPTSTAPTVAPTTTAPTTAPPTTAPTTAPTTPAPVTPQAPTGVSATAGLASITVSWNAPAANGAVITGYRATAFPGGASCTSTGASCVVGGDAGTSYTVSVVAVSAAGDSPSSASSNAVTPTELTVPNAPPVTNLPLEMPDGPVTSAAPGGKLKMSGRGYAPFSVITLAVYSKPTVLGTVTADADGAFETEVDVPDNLSVGTHSFVAAGVDKSGKFRALRLDLPIAKSSTGTTLPTTGSALLWLFVAGFASVVTGVAVRRLAR
ncbi:hypothetical protein [Actinoplanes sp. NPDC026619]|uniref:fibronectin type III domain-containing protein n=1 Tax=Actinoplanes sp. NPDC026619 TaxID=3155798 RepID=UPI0033C76447